jgi:hypothetical protein
MASPPAMLNHKIDDKGIAGFKNAARRSRQRVKGGLWSRSNVNTLSCMMQIDDREQMACLAS